MECLLPYLCMVTVPHIMVGLERMLDYRGVGLERFHYSMLGNYLIITLIMIFDRDNYHICMQFHITKSLEKNTIICWYRTYPSFQPHDV